MGLCGRLEIADPKLDLVVRADRTDERGPIETHINQPVVAMEVT